MLFEGKISNLDDLLSPMSRKEFFKYYLDQTPILIRADDPSRATRLVNVQEVSEIVFEGLHSDGRIVLFQNGRPVPTDDYSTQEPKPRLDPILIRRLLQSGASLVINGLDDAHKSVGDLTQALELEFASNVWANAYITLNEGGVFSEHFDDHDVIVLQVTGSKRWRLFGKTEEFALHPGKSLGDAPTLEKNSYFLAPGDVLFIPRGDWHRAEVVDGPCFHITFGVGGSTGLDLVIHELGELAQEAIFRRYLPRLAGEKALAQHERQLISHLHKWVDRLSAKLFLESLDSARRTRSRPSLWGDLRIEGTTKVSLGARRLPSKLFVEIGDAEDLVLGGRNVETDPTSRLILKIVFQRSLLTFEQLASEVHSSGEVASRTDLIDIVVRLVECGILNIKND